jgi:hypothetical protein
VIADSANAKVPKLGGGVSLVQEEMIDVQRLDVQIGRTDLLGDEAGAILVLALDQPIVDHREVHAGRGIVVAGLLLSLLVDATAVEDREEVGKLQRRDHAKGQCEPISRRQRGAVEADAGTGEIGLHNRMAQQPLVQPGKVLFVVARRHTWLSSGCGRRSSAGRRTLAHQAVRLQVLRISAHRDRGAAVSFGGLGAAQIH